MVNKSKSGWKIVHIPDKPPISPHLQPTVDVHATVVEPKLANTLVRKLNQIAPLENLRHVKRVRKQCLDGGKSQLSVILCLACENDCRLDSMPSAVIELINSFQLSTFVAKVCEYVASSKEEWEEQCKLWPTSYHPPTYNIDGITGFNEEDAQLVFTFMKFAIDLAKSGVDQVVNAAVIVDPATKQVIVSACDQVLSSNTSVNKTSAETGCFEHPEATPYCPMANGVDNHVSSLSNCSSDNLEQLSSGVSCLHPHWWVEQELSPSSCFWHPLRHAAIVAIENSAARDMRLFPASGHIEHKVIQAHTMQFSKTSPPLKRHRTRLTNWVWQVKYETNFGVCSLWETTHMFPKVEQLENFLRLHHHMHFMG